MIMDEDLELKFTNELVAGGAAGTAADMILYPLDTIKTRLQSQNGFLKSGGFSGIYRGIGPAFLGSAPNAALFFATYENTKKFLEGQLRLKDHPGIHMGAAILGEITACTIRVPVEIVKQRRQALNYTTKEIFTCVWKTEGFFGFYRGYFSTIMREIPFSAIQLPLWEYAKYLARLYLKREVNPLESAYCGAFAGGLSAAITTPLDVAKTRIMLAKKSSIEAKGNITHVLKIVYKEGGVKGLYAGIIPRTIWISLGGSIFFGTYEFAKKLFHKFGTD